MLAKGAGLDSINMSRLASSITGVGLIVFCLCASKAAVHWLTKSSARILLPGDSLQRHLSGVQFNLASLEQRMSKVGGL